jgi:TRIAD3 protein (E3 ubiquitin-protein ligase RNF216)
MALWDRLTQRKEVQAAGLDGWEECPFCEWGCVIEDAEEEFFICENIDGCGIVSCRGCKKLVRSLFSSLTRS